MYGVALGTGPSLSAYKRHNHPQNTLVIGANDIYSKCPDIDAVACADTGRRVIANRPLFSLTPHFMPVYSCRVMNGRKSNESFDKVFPDHNVMHVPSPRMNRKNYKPLLLDMFDGVVHGTCTPVWIVALLLAMGKKFIYVYGVDLRGHESMDSETRRLGIGEELHRLHIEAKNRFGGFVKLTAESPLHADLLDLKAPFKLEMF